MRRKRVAPVTRRTLLGGALVGGLAVAAGRRLRRPTGSQGRPQGRLRRAVPWAALREEVVDPDDLGASDPELVG